MIVPEERRFRRRKRYNSDGTGGRERYNGQGIIREKRYKNDKTRGKKDWEGEKIQER